MALRPGDRVRTSHPATESYRRRDAPHRRRHHHHRARPDSPARCSSQARADRAVVLADVRARQDFPDRLGRHRLPLLRARPDDASASIALPTQSLQTQARRPAPGIHAETTRTAAKKRPGLIRPTSLYGIPPRDLTRPANTTLRSKSSTSPTDASRDFHGPRHANRVAHHQTARTMRAGENADMLIRLRNSRHFAHIARRPEDPNRIPFPQPIDPLLSSFETTTE